jgi:neutral ceramidase
LQSARKAAKRREQELLIIVRSDAPADEIAFSVDNPVVADQTSSRPAFSEVPTMTHSTPVRFRLWKRITFTCLTLLLSGSFAAAAEPEWKVGLAQIKITPEQPVQMSGYASRTKPFEKVAAELYAKAMVLEDRDGHRAVMVTSDLLGFPADVAEPICERLQKKIGLKREQILLNSAHTHAGPILSLNAPAKDDPNSGEALRTVEYTHKLQDKVVEVVVQATEHLEPARLSWGGGVIDFVMNRREFTTTGGVILGNNPRGLADRSVPVLRVDSTAGKLLAVLFGCACHNTTLGPDNMQISGDYAGFAQAYLQEKYPNVQAMFMIGCAGDANPYPRGTMELARKHGTALGEEVCRVLEAKLTPVGGPLRIAFARLDLPLNTSLSREELEKLAANKRDIRSYCATKMVALLDKGEKLPTHYTCPQTVWQFGEDLTLVGLSGEVVVDYVPLLEKALRPNKLWIAAYCNDVYGYLPSARVISEGGYETRGLYSGGAGFFDAKAEEVLVRKVRELAKEAGRKVPD